MRRSLENSLGDSRVDDRLSVFDIASEEISFHDRSMNCCIGFVDMVNSTNVTAEIFDRRKIGQYYSIFINTMAVLAKKYGAKIVKNAGDATICYIYSIPCVCSTENTQGNKKLDESIDPLLSLA